MTECPACGYEFEPDDDDLATGPLNVADASAAILRHYKADFNLGERLALEEAIKECLTKKLDISAGLL